MRATAFRISFSRSSELSPRKIFLNRSAILKWRDDSGGLKGNRAEASDDKDVRDKMQEASAASAEIPRGCLPRMRGGTQLPSRVVALVDIYATILRELSRLFCRPGSEEGHFISESELKIRFVYSYNVTQKIQSHRRSLDARKLKI